MDDGSTKEISESSLSGSPYTVMPDLDDESFLMSAARHLVRPRPLTQRQAIAAFALCVFASFLIREYLFHLFLKFFPSLSFFCVSLFCIYSILFIYLLPILHLTSIRMFANQPLGFLRFMEKVVFLIHRFVVCTSPLISPSSHPPPTPSLPSCFSPFSLLRPAFSPASACLYCAFV